nr:myomy protein - rat [Rattus norvegicus]
MPRVRPKEMGNKRPDHLVGCGSECLREPTARATIQDQAGLSSDTASPAPHCWCSPAFSHSRHGHQCLHMSFRRVDLLRCRNLG